MLGVDDDSQSLNNDISDDVGGHSDESHELGTGEDLQTLTNIFSGMMEICADVMMIIHSVQEA
ncbi:hypothetical protein B0H19DRAFT_1185799 [Mycena capillaripes]|nr:hypothetical protein B0H19DRAFT_1185799 [Mycena capillaripes]